MEKSIRNIDSTASHIVNMSLESLSQPVNTDATGLVNPSKSIANAQTREPSNMYGLRRPNRDVELSASTPINGCIIKPDNGPAINTVANLDLVSPKESKYGEA